MTTLVIFFLFFGAICMISFLYELVYTGSQQKYVTSFGIVLELILALNIPVSNAELVDVRI